MPKIIRLRPRLKESIFGEVLTSLEGVPCGNYPACKEKFVRICFSEWNRKFEWMAAEIPVSADFEERMWVNTISSGDNIEGHDKVIDKSVPGSLSYT